MLTVVLVLLLFHTLLVKPKPGMLCCGLFGGSFNQPIADKIIWRLKTLGLFNQSRGSDSCGIYNGDDLIKGVDGNKKFYDFVVNVGVPPNSGKNNVFIGHTRNSTMGAHTAENAHPFNIADKLIFAHNGKIENAWELCRLNDIDSLPLHVDSQGLGHLLAKVGTSILEKYKGYAAILSHDLSKPGVLYAYHGAAKRWKTDDKLEEERPLFFMKTPEGIYFSSMKDSLLFIKEKDDSEPETLPHNIVFTIKDGVVIKQSKYIHREEVNVFSAPSTTHTNTTVYPGYKNYNSDSNSGTNSRTGKAWSSSDTNSQTPEYHNISLETLPKEFSTDDGIYYYRNRYWVNTDKCDGVINVLPNGKVLKEDKSVATKITTLYFFKGILLKSQKEYNLIHKQLQSSDSELMKTLSFSNRNFAKVVSKWSKYPVTNVDDQSKDVDVEFRTKFYLNDKEVSTESTQPLYSERIYNYKDGRLKKITAESATGGTPTMPFFLQHKSAGGSGTEKGGSEKSGTGAFGNTQHSEAREKDADKQRLSVIDNIRDRLRLSKVSPNIEKAISLFYTKYGSEEEICRAMDGIGDEVMKLYAYDLMQNLAGMTSPKQEIIVEAICDIYYQAVKEGVELYELMENGVEEVEYYIGEILENWDFPEDDNKPDDVIDVEAEEVKEETAEELVKKILHSGVRAPFTAPPAGMQADIFKDFDKKKEFPY